MRKLLCSALLLLFAATMSLANEAVFLKSGKIVSGKVVSLDDTKVVFDVPDGDDTTRVEVPLADIDPSSVYELKARRTHATDGTARLALGEWCLKAGIPYFAIREFERAGKLDPKLADKAKDGLARARLARGKAFYIKAVRAMKAGDLREAERLFTILVKHYPAFAPQAKKSIAAIERQRASGYRPVVKGGNGNGNGGGGKTAAKVKLPAGTAKKLSAIQKHIEGASIAGYRAKTDTRARRHFEAGYDATNHALGILAGLEKAKKITDAEREELAKPFVKRGVDLCIQVAVIYLRQDNEYGGNRWLNKALILDPLNARAKELRLYIITEFRDRRRGRPGIR